MSLLSKQSQTQNHIKDNYWPIPSTNICYNGYKKPSQHPQSHMVPRPFGYPRKWTGRPTSQRGNSAPLIIRTNNYTQHLPCMQMPEKGLDHSMEKLLSTTRQLGNSKLDTTIPIPYTSLPSASRQERAIWMTSTVQNRTQLLRGILPKVCLFSRPSLSIWWTYTDTRTYYPIMFYLWKTLHCPMQSVMNAVPPWPPWHQGWHRSYNIVGRIASSEGYHRPEVARFAFSTHIWLDLFI